MSSPRVFPATAAGWHRHVLVLAYPIVLANLTQPILAAVDTAVAGHLADPAALGGVALGGVLFSFLLWGFGFLRMGTTGLVARAHGARDELALREHLLRGLLLAVLIGLALLALQSLVIAPALGLLGGSAVVQGDALAYARARIWSAPFSLANYVLLGYCLGRQQVRLGLLLQVAINLANIVAVLALVYVAGLGVAGIGAATACADAFGCLLGLALLARLGAFRGARRPSWAALLEPGALRHTLLINRDIFLRTICLLGSFAWFAHAGADQGDLVLAANALLLNFQSFMAFGLDGFAHAAEALVGAALGARDRAALRMAIRTTLLWSAVGAAGFSLAYALAGPGIVALLTDQPALRATAAHYLPWVVALPLASVAGFLFDGVFIGATRTRELMRAMLICSAAFWLLAQGLRPLLGNHGLWLAFLSFMALRGISLGLLLPRIGAELGQAGARPEGLPEDCAGRA